MSSYLVLARKYRPRDFREVIGQEVVTEVLRGALSGGHVGQAYLFAGPRGTGKTTLARIFAKCLNCEKGPTATPCGTCERCLESDSGRDVDLIEIDAASHTSVENIRELRDEVAYAPMRARYKVYLIDEVHMLSKSAFNALLKTLEEPPPHVVFLFATTEPHKVLDTILSRCQILRLSSLSEERIAARLDEVLAAEGVRAGAGVTPELARLARGGMRDALSLADKLLAFAGNEPGLEDLRRLGGETGTQELDALLLLAERGERATLLERLAAMEGDEEEALNGLLELLRAAALLAHCGEATPLVTLTGAERKTALERGQRLGVERLELFLQELLRARERMRLLPGQERLVLELVLLDLARADTTVPLGGLVERIEALERRLTSGAPAQAAPAAAPGRAPAGGAPSAAPSPARAPAEGAAPATARPPAKPFDAFVADLQRTHGALATLFARHGAKVLAENDAGRVLLTFGPLTEGEERLVRDKRNLAACARAYERAFGRPTELEVAASGAPRKVERPPPTKDLFTQRLAQQFDGTVEDLS